MSSIESLRSRAGALSERDALLLATPRFGRGSLSDGSSNAASPRSDEGATSVTGGSDRFAAGRGGATTGGRGDAAPATGAAGGVAP